MSIDGPRSVCPVLGHLGGGVVPATRGQVLRSQEVLFNGPGGMCVFLCAKKKQNRRSAAKTMWVFLHGITFSLLVFTLKEKMLNSS